MLIHANRNSKRARFITRVQLAITRRPSIVQTMWRQTITSNRIIGWIIKLDDTFLSFFSLFFFRGKKLAFSPEKFLFYYSQFRFHIEGMFSRNSKSFFFFSFQLVLIRVLSQRNFLASPFNVDPAINNIVNLMSCDERLKNSAVVIALDIELLM